LPMRMTILRPSVAGWFIVLLAGVACERLGPPSAVLYALSAAAGGLWCMNIARLYSSPSNVFGELNEPQLATTVWTQRASADVIVPVNEGK
jgi:hypothetical protein